MMRRTLMMIAVLSLAGCSNGTNTPKTAAPTIDTTNDDFLKSSLERINQSLPAAARKEFEEDCSILLVENKDVRPDERSSFRPSRKAERYQKIKGLTAKQVHDKAERRRKQNEITQAEAKKAQIVVDEKALLDNLQAIARRAEASLKREAADRFGPDMAKQAHVVANDDDIKKVGDRAWEVMVHYQGPNRDGENFQGTWKVRIELTSGRLESPSCDFAKLDKPPARPTPPAPASPPAPAIPTIASQNGTNRGGPSRKEKDSKVEKGQPSGPVIAAKLQSFSPPDKSFTVSMPGVPKPEKQDLEDGSMKIDSYEVNLGDRSYLAACYELRNGVPRADQGMAMEAICTSIAAESKGTVSKMKEIRFDGLKGREVFIDYANPEKTKPDVGRARVFLVGQRAFMIYYRGEKGTAERDEVQKFFTSLRVNKTPTLAKARTRP